MASPSAIQRRPLALLAVCAALLASACGGGGTPAPTGGGSPSTTPAGSGSAACPAIPPPAADPAGWPSEPGSVDPNLITTPVVCGPNRLLFSFVDGLTPVATPDRSASIALYELGRDPNTPVAAATGTFVWAIEDVVGVYVANLSVPSSGRYGAEFVTSVAGGQPETIRMTFDVHPESPVIGVGDSAPASSTPTLDDVDGDLARISTDDDADPAFYETSVDEALAAHEPFLVAFATPKFCRTAQCGPTLDRIKPFIDQYPTVTFINVEPYELTFENGSLEPVLGANNDLQPVAASNEWGLLHEPIVFVVDRQGVVQSVFELIFSDEELAAALDQVK